MIFALIFTILFYGTVYVVFLVIREILEEHEGPISPATLTDDGKPTTTPQR